MLTADERRTTREAKLLTSRLVEWLVYSVRILAELCEPIRVLMGYAECDYVNMSTMNLPDLATVQYHHRERHEDRLSVTFPYASRGAGRANEARGTTRL